MKKHHFSATLFGRQTAQLLFAPFLVLFLLSAGVGCGAEAPSPAGTIREGDIIFQTTRSPQSLAITIATKSEYTHCGVILEKDGRLQVFEAIRKVGWTPLEDWVKRGVNQHYVLMRLKKPIGPEAVAIMRESASAFAGKDYDLLFQWSDDKIYCSELVWKLYRKAGVELCEPRAFRDFDLNHDEVRKIVRQRYGRELPPLDEPVVAPSDLMRCDLLEVVAKN